MAIKSDDSVSVGDLGGEVVLVLVEEVAGVAGRSAAHRGRPLVRSTSSASNALVGVEDLTIAKETLANSSRTRGISSAERRRDRMVRSQNQKTKRLVATYLCSL